MATDEEVQYYMDMFGRQHLIPPPAVAASFPELSERTMFDLIQCHALYNDFDRLSLANKLLAVAWIVRRVKSIAQMLPDVYDRLRTIKGQLDAGHAADARCELVRLLQVSYGPWGDCCELVRKTEAEAALDEPFALFLRRTRWPNSTLGAKIVQWWHEGEQKLAAVAAVHEALEASPLAAGDMGAFGPDFLAMVLAAHATLCHS